MTTEDVLTILRTIIEPGHKTTVNRVRRYLSAAYTFRLVVRLIQWPVKRVAKFESAGDKLAGDVVRMANK